MFQKKTKPVEKDSSNSSYYNRKKLTPKERLGTIFKVVILPALFAGIVVCGLYLSMQNKLEAASMKGKVLVMNDNISANTFINYKDAKKFLTCISVEKIAIPANAYTDFLDLPKAGFYIENAMDKSQMLLKDDVASNEIVMDKYKSGYEVTSFATDSFDDSVNGSLRKGDIVDVYALDPSSEMLVPMAENVYISDVYDNSGKKITEDDGVATSFTVWTTPEEIESINTAIVYGGIQMYLKP